MESAKGRVAAIASLLCLLGLAAQFAAGQGVGSATSGIAPVASDQTLYIILIIELIVNVCLFAAVIALLIALPRKLNKSQGSRRR